ncbi:hypothetical protein HYH02_012507 [Chlamydomonas schloesseri]|uniref:Protein kinase domain-containing protein n=1 Tax=Chlamydomonas schloesseri TaxID=2026947 RepID=A0A835W1N4_9CHLO|nr:hypothetical protein HYH02_012507 [Chlamydomonas schloesseri]|eukprot:KAG2433963.1 hypothetical protein HYH02_012507 [Chlamydomonas schloesseri]
MGAAFSACLARRFGGNDLRAAQAPRDTSTLVFAALPETSERFVRKNSHGGGQGDKLASNGRPAHENRTSTSEAGRNAHTAASLSQAAGPAPSPLPEATAGVRVCLESTAPSLLATARSLISADDVLVESVEELTQSIQIKDLIGTGGFAYVFKGVYQASEVAVKLALAPKNTDRERFCREAVLAQQLRHPHVVATYVARGAVMTSEMITAIYQSHQQHAAEANVVMPGGAFAGTGTGGSIALRHRVPAAFNLLPTLPSTRSDDNMGNPRVAPQQDQQGEAGGWVDALHSVGVLPDQILMVIVQELCDVGSLAAALRRGVLQPQPGHISPMTARRMLVRTAAEVCRGMLHLHNSNVIHGDLKPANVLLCRSRKDRRGFMAKVADFGLSKLLYDDTSHVMSDHIGTVAYSSPEAIQGYHSRACDVWSFGVMLWEMINHERPFARLTPAQIMMGVGFDGLKPEWPRQAWPELCVIGERCLASNPTARPSFAQLEEELVLLEEALREESRRMALDRAAAVSMTSATSTASSGPPGGQEAARAAAFLAAPAAAHGMTEAGAGR